MEQERRQRLAQLDYERNLPILDSLLDFAYLHRKPQPSCGLLELQRILLRQREAR